MGSVALDGIQWVSSVSGPEGAVVLPQNVLYSGGKLQWRNVIAPGLGSLLPAIDKVHETGATPFRFNPDNGALWVDNTASKVISKKSGKFTGSTTVTTSTELILNNAVTQVIYLSYGAYQLTQEAEIWFSYGTASSNLGIGQAVPSSSSFIRFIAPAKAIIAKDFGDSRILRGNPQQSLWLNVAAATPAPDVRWNIFYSIEDEFWAV